MTEIFISIGITCVSTVLTTLIGLFIKRGVEKKLDKNMKDQEELIELRSEKERQERKADVLATLQAELDPIKTSMENIYTTLTNNTEGTVTLLRETMKQTRDQFVNQGYASASDVASWFELYNTYKKLGGNHFKEYVDAWKVDVERLPRDINEEKRA